jgi:hypothetical protein
VRTFNYRRIQSRRIKHIMVILLPPCPFSCKFHRKRHTDVSSKFGAEGTFSREGSLTRHGSFDARHAKNRPI